MPRFTTPLAWMPAVLLVLACQAPGAAAQPRLVDRLHDNAVASFREARFSEAYGRFISLADAGHAPAAEHALWMYRNGPSLFGKDWDISQEQLTAWAQLARQPVPTLTGQAYPRTLVPVANRPR